MLSRSERLSNELNLSRQTTDRISVVYTETVMGTEYTEDSAMSSIKRGGAGTGIMSATPQMSKASQQKQRQVETDKACFDCRT